MLEALSGETGRSVTQVALNWLLQRPTVAAIVIGARNEDQLRENLGAVDFTLSTEQVARLDAASHRTAAYPYWHQWKTFSERSPSPVPLLPLRKR
jgi:aryl-alcohol dehydrogenase-like predicted oxidoreductase